MSAASKVSLIEDEDENERDFEGFGLVTHYESRITKMGAALRILELMG